MASTILGTSFNSYLLATTESSLYFIQLHDTHYCKKLLSSAIFFTFSTSQGDFYTLQWREIPENMNLGKIPNL